MGKSDIASIGERIKRIVVLKAETKAKFEEFVAIVDQVDLNIEAVEADAEAFIERI